MSKIIKIGGASGFWGDSMLATPQLLAHAGLDYIVYDYLAEITMSIMARARAANPDMGYATDFVSGVIKPHAKDIARTGVKILANAGGVNPRACAKAVQAVLAEQNIDLKVAFIEGDDLREQKEVLRATYKEMFTGEAFPDVDKLASVNAYLGAFPVAAALDAGADIVITGRSVDSAVTLGACIHEFGWQAEAWDKLAGGSLAGHIIECGPQATGGNFTDWQEVGMGIATIGYPIVEVNEQGDFICTKPDNTGGVVNVGTVSEQMLYEIGDPQAYILPDVTCDFSTTKITQIGDNRVQVSGTTGHPASATYKVSATYFDGFRGGSLLSFVGVNAPQAAQIFAEALFARCREMFRQHNMADFDETSCEIIGADSQYGKAVADASAREVVLKFAAKHEDQKAIAIMLKEATGLALATPAGLSGFAGARPKPSPLVRLFSFLIPKEELSPHIYVAGEGISFSQNNINIDAAVAPPRPDFPPLPEDAQAPVPLYKLAWARSGDKGNKANIGVIARKADYMPYICASLTREAVQARFAHFIEAGSTVDRFYLPASHALNFLLHAALGGGGIASLRNDPQAKAYAQILLDHPILVPQTLADSLE